MKATRILSVALAAVLPLLLTSCDDSYYASPEEMLQGYWKIDLETYDYIDSDGLVWKTDSYSYSADPQYNLFDWGRLYTYAFDGVSWIAYDEGNYYISGNYLSVGLYDYYIEYLTPTDMKLSWEGYDDFGYYYVGTRFMYKADALP